MRTVKQVSKLTGISVRTLHYYDEIGLLKPSETTEAHYRLYDDEALETLQQILFFKELDFSLKEVKDIITNPQFDKMQALKNHKKLLQIKQNHLNDLIGLVDQILEGANTLSFKEFDMSDYFNALEEFKREHTDEVAKHWGSIDNFNEFIKNCKSNEAEIAKMAIKQFGSIEKYTEAMKKNLNNFSNVMEGVDKLKDNAADLLEKTNELMNRLTADLGKDLTSKEIQHIIQELDEMTIENYKTMNMDMGENYWGLMADLYLSNATNIEVTDKKYGMGASKFIGQALKCYSENKK